MPTKKKDAPVEEPKEKPTESPKEEPKVEETAEHPLAGDAEVKPLAAESPNSPQDPDTTVPQAIRELIADRDAPEGEPVGRERSQPWR